MSPETTDASSLVGRVIQDRFRILQRIASGGMGAVYLAEQLPLGRKVALKVLEIAAENIGGRAQFQERFLLEAAAVAKLSHPNTIVLYDYGRTEDGLFYYAMELIEGTTLSKLISARRSLDPGLAVHVAAQICGSLREAHELGLVHRDLKPGNVMLTRRGDDEHYVKVLDFGLVKVIGDSDGGSELTRSGIVMGSPRYMAPEQVESRAVDHRADIYAFGALLYHMLAGQPPFLYPSQFETLRAQVDEAPPPLEAKNPWCQAGPELRALMYQCLEKKPDRRPQSMAEVAQRLKACAMEIGISVPSVSSFDVSRLAPAPSAAPAPAAPSISESAPVSMHSMHSVHAPQPAPISMHSVHAPQPAPLPAPPPPRSGRAFGWVAAVALIAMAGLGAAALAFVLPAGEAPPEVAVAPAPPIVAPPVVVPAPPPPPPALPAPPVAGPVQLVSDPPGARVRHGEADLGDAPLVLTIPPDERWELTLSLEGHEPRTITVAAGRPSVSVRLSPVPAATPSRRPVRPAQPDPVQPRPFPDAPSNTWSRPGPRTDNRDPWAQ